MFKVLQWSNILAIDAALIAIAWQTVFATISGQALDFPEVCVLGISVWLTYCADRLFDVKKRPLEKLYSTRHRFTKRHAKTILKVWFGALVINVSIAFTGLTTNQLLNGAILLTFCLLYTGLNQKLSDRFFPKELCVAVIYAGGVVVFLLPDSTLWLPTGFLALLCLINCLMTSGKERPIDAAMNVHSIAQSMPRLLIVLFMLCPPMLGLIYKQWLLPLCSSLVALALVQLCRKRLTVESFRVLADAALFVGPMLYLLVSVG